MSLKEWKEQINPGSPSTARAKSDKPKDAYGIGVGTAFSDMINDGGIKPWLAIYDNENKQNYQRILNQFKQDMNDKMYNPDYGIMYKQGDQAKGISSLVRINGVEIANYYSSQIKDKKYQQLFLADAESDVGQYAVQTMKHEAKETRLMRDNDYNLSIKNVSDKVNSYPYDVDKETAPLRLADTKTIVRNSYDYAIKEKGLSPEMAKEFASQEVTKVWQPKIQSLMDQRMTKEASDLLLEQSPFMDPKTVNDLQVKLDLLKEDDYAFAMGKEMYKVYGDDPVKIKQHLIEKGIDSRQHRSIIGYAGDVGKQEKELQAEDLKKKREAFFSYIYSLPENSLANESTKKKVTDEAIKVFGTEKGLEIINKSFNFNVKKELKNGKVVDVGSGGEEYSNKTSEAAKSLFRDALALGRFDKDPEQEIPLLVKSLAKEGHEIRADQAIVWLREYRNTVGIGKNTNSYADDVLQTFRKTGEIGKGQVNEIGTTMSNQEFGQLVFIYKRQLAGIYQEELSNGNAGPINPARYHALLDNVVRDYFLLGIDGTKTKFNVFDPNVVTDPRKINIYDDKNNDRIFYKTPDGRFVDNK